MPADYHSHTPLCHHAEGTAQAYVDAAMSAGLSAYGVSEHAPVSPEPFDDWRLLEKDFSLYLQWIEDAEEHAQGRIPVRAGLECDWLNGCETYIEALSQRHPWDYLIGSVHYLGKWDFDNPIWLEKWSSVDVEAIWQDYWNTYTAMAKSGLFDILGHPDLIKKFGYRPNGDLDRYYEPAIQAIAASGCAIEINTAGLHKPCAEMYPSPRFLELAFCAGVPLVISSDAHAPEQIGRNFKEAISLAHHCGYRETILFEKRSRQIETFSII